MTVSSAVQSSQLVACPNCERLFRDNRGLGVHRQRVHPLEYNAEIRVPVRALWSTEELLLMARHEAKGIAEGARFMNQYLLGCGSFSGRSLEAIKGARRRSDYKLMVQSAIAQMANDSTNAINEETIEEVTGSVSEARAETGSTRLEVPDYSTIYGAIKYMMWDTVVPGQGFRADTLRCLAGRALAGVDVTRELQVWLTTVFSAVSTGHNQPRPNRQRPVKRRKNPSKRGKRRQLRRKEFKDMQSLWKVNRSRAAKSVLDGKTGQVNHSLDQLKAFWEPLMGKESCEFDGPVKGQKTNKDTGSIWAPIMPEEIETVRIPVKSASGLDAITARTWNAVPSVIRALFYNVLMLLEKVPEELLQSRTIFIPKKDMPELPGEYRPISVASVVLRQFHKILARRIERLHVFDSRQRGFTSADGVAENISVLDAVLHTARSSLREVHAVTLDIVKAFDSLSHRAMEAILEARGLPSAFCRYFSYMYRNVVTTFQLGSERSSPVFVRSGVRQGDPLSPLVFNLCVDELLASIPKEVGFILEGVRVSGLAFADDLVIISSSKMGMNIALEETEAAARRLGLRFHPTKCSALSMIPDGKNKKIKIMAESQFHLSDGPLPQATAVSQWRYLGVDFSPKGVMSMEVELSTSLNRLTRAPLKPQQRLAALRMSLLPRFTHGLVLGNVTAGRLNQMDKQVRKAIRLWLRLPKDVPVAYMHAPVKDGGLGIPSFQTTIPLLTANRLRRLENSAFTAASAAFRSNRVQRKLGWAEKLIARLRVEERSNRKSFWTQRLHQSVDGFELRESSRCSGSTRWIAANCDGIPGRDYVQYIHTHINALPSKVRTSRGRRREGQEPLCRAGCQLEETTAHIIQGCHRTHGGRVKRHDAICATLASTFRSKGWQVETEPRIITNVGLRKPDILATKEGTTLVVDAQVVSGSGLLNRTHQEKIKKYMEIDDFTHLVAQRCEPPATSVEMTTATITWRGVWAPKSYTDLICHGVPSGVLGSLTTRVLQGSHTNWNRFNCMTTIGRPMQQSSRA